MHIETKDGVKQGVELWAVEGSHLYVRSASGADVYLEWNDLPEDVKEKALKARELSAALERSADEMYWRVVEASA